MTFNQLEYNKKYNKEKYSRFLVDLPKEEKEELDKMLKEDGINKAEFLKKAIIKYKKTRKKS